MSRIGAIPSLNALPLTDALRGWRGGDVRWDSPAALAAALARRELDLALIPQVEAMASPDYRMVRGLGIASRGPVESILLFTSHPWKRIERVAVDRASRSSAELLRVLFHLEGLAPPELEPAPASLRPEEIDSVGVDALLLIGDRALAARGSTVARHDLGERWRARTGLPFVFAVWAGREDVPVALRETVASAAADGELRREAIAREFARRHPEVIDEEAAVRYLGATLHYRLGEAEEQALRQFAALRGEIGRQEPDLGALRWFGEGE